jgi:CBS domain-containing membrane protein
MKRKIFQLRIVGAQSGDRLVACGAAMCSIALTMLICAEFPLLSRDLPVIIAPLRASAIMVFVIPSSPLAQPWRLVGGNVISTLIGVAVFQIVAEPAVAAGIAVGAAILGMSLLRCLHPPGGAAALTAVIGSADIHAAGYASAFVPVGINSIALITFAMLIHRWTGHSYPHQQASQDALQKERSAAGFERSDFDHALEDLHETFDVGRADLELLLSRATVHAEKRRQGITGPSIAEDPDRRG